MYTFGPIAAAIAFASTVLTALTTVLTPLAGAAGAAAAIVCLTAIVRVAVLPLSVAQVRGEKARARLAPRLLALREKHAENPQRLVAEQQRVYTEEGTSPLAGCLPMLAQMPVFIVLYGLFTSATISGAPNGLLTHTLGGVPLGATLGDVLAVGSGPQSAVFAVLLVVLTGVAWASRRWLALPALTASAASGAPVLPGAQAMSYLSFGTVAIAAFVPLAAGLYLATTTAWTVAERLALRHLITG
ncbi:YidC/Oxa1 family membrane protein insertase [Nocardiopsis mwathae]|uniref:Membrane protein insertase YidC n=1 Tax=Nocardiopsis mwathae TaxID=1472723 RepID=A0A7W9YKQ5_9ACTN|nr:membrane protein insertase YidC [Nocardiopsis mwathae]MBB6173968.1 YidC/Oxa1 family membrane protein insertase [Nocardiopsis mwathae]